MAIIYLLAILIFQEMYNYIYTSSYSKMSNMFPLVSFIPYTPSGVFPFHQSCDRRSPSLRPAPASRAATANTANTANTTNTASRSRRRARRRPSSVLGDKRQCRPGNQTWLGSLNGQIQYIHKYSINILIYAVNKYIHNIYMGNQSK